LDTPQVRNVNSIQVIIILHYIDQFSKISKKEEEKNSNKIAFFFLLKKYFENQNGSCGDAVVMGELDNGHLGCACIGNRTTHRIPHAKTTHRSRVSSNTYVYILVIPCLGVE